MPQVMPKVWRKSNQDPEFLVAPKCNRAVDRRPPPLLSLIYLSENRVEREEKTISISLIVWVRSSNLKVKVSQGTFVYNGNIDSRPNFRPISSFYAQFD